MSTPPDPIIQIAQSAMREFHMVAQGSSVLVAVSGGPDSVCLVHALHELGVNIAVAHFDHGTREGASAEDAAFVKRLADALEVPFHLGQASAGALSDESRLSFEMAARKSRYAFLTRTAKSVGCSSIATGHHSGDQTETILMRLIRGTSPKGLKGIPPVGEWDGVAIIRPLIRASRSQVLEFLGARDLDFRTDASNEDPAHLRNRVRHSLLPLLERDYNPQVGEALRRLAEIQGEEDEFLDGLLQSFKKECMAKESEIDRDLFSAAHGALQRRLIVDLSTSLGCAVDFERIEMAVAFVCHAASAKKFHLGGTVMLCNGRHSTKILRDDDSPSLDRSVPVAFPGETQAFGRRFSVQHLDEVPRRSPREVCGPDVQIFDSEGLGNELALRTRRPGDRFAPLGLQGHKTLKEYLSDVHVPLWERDEQLLLTAGGKIVWVVGHTIDASVAVGPETKRCVQIEVFDETQ